MDGYYARGWLILDDLYLNQLYSGMVVLKSKQNRHSESEALFRLPRGSSVRSLREPEESLNACLHDRVCLWTVYYRSH